MTNDRRNGERRYEERRKTDRKTTERRKFDRRRLLKIGAMATITGLFHHPVFGAVERLSSSCKNISLFNIHTGESLDVVYCAEGEYFPSALKQINTILRDHRTGETKPIDRRLLDLLHAICQKTHTSEPIHIISGYRSAATNTLLRKNSKGVASRSLHMDGKAADIRIPGCDLERLREVAVKLKTGGVGYYAQSDFVHVDIGRVRYW